MAEDKKPTRTTGRKGEPIGRLALKKRLITRDQLQEAIDLHGDDENKKRIGEILRDKGWIDDAAIEAAVELHGSSAYGAYLRELLTR